MRSSRLRLARPIYFVIVVVITELVLVIGAVLILLPTGFLSRLPLAVFGFVLLFKTITTIIALIIVGNMRPLQSRVSVCRGAGLILGWIVGLLLGGVLGGRYGGTFWAIIGLVGGYLLVGRVGARISYAIGAQLERLFPSGEKGG
ncbi:MAG: hypothetical protein HY258_13015 [Chloroflexi bacterium]|nr:hypothetical protein [Chloroflexota bacterium]